MVLFIATSVEYLKSHKFTQNYLIGNNVRRMKEHSTKRHPSVEAKGKEKVRNTTEERT
jgi:hypothetical protein